MLGSKGEKRQRNVVMNLYCALLELALLLITVDFLLNGIAPVKLTKFKAFWLIPFKLSKVSNDASCCARVPIL